MPVDLPVYIAGRLPLGKLILQVPIGQSLVSTSSSAVEPIVK